MSLSSFPSHDHVHDKCRSYISFSSTTVRLLHSVYCATMAFHQDISNFMNHSHKKVTAPEYKAIFSATFTPTGTIKPEKFLDVLGPRLLLAS